MLPTKKKQAKKTGPGTFLIYSLPKAGKTSIVAALEDALIINLEPGGTDYVECLCVDIDEGDDLKNIQKFNDTLKEIKESETKYKYIILDTATKLDEWSELAGTLRYMQKPQGKLFNKGVEIDSAAWETVHDIGQGYGYKHSRAWILEKYEELRSLTDHLVILAHIKDRMVESKSGDTVTQKDISLTGKVKSILSSRVDAIGYFYRKGDQGFLSFQNKENVIAGGRCDHLSDILLISEKTPEGVKVHWDKVYL